MLEITEPARELLDKMVCEANSTAELAARIRMAEKGFSIHLDRPAPDDTTFSHNGRVILVLDVEASRTLDGRTLDVQASDGELRLGLQ